MAMSTDDEQDVRGEALERVSGVEADRRRAPRRITESTRPRLFKRKRDSRLQPSDEWYTTRQAAAAMNISVQTMWFLVSLIGPAFPITRKSRSTLGATCDRGCGSLWSAADIASFNRIRRACHVGPRDAIKVMTAMRAGEL